jgi:hypothetical protein
MSRCEKEIAKRMKMRKDVKCEKMSMRGDEW